MMDTLCQLKNAFPLIDEKYKISSQVGSGTFSQVFFAVNRKSKNEVAIKNIIPTSAPSRILTELQCLRKLG